MFQGGTGGKGGFPPGGERGLSGGFDDDVVEVYLGYFSFDCTLFTAANDIVNGFDGRDGAESGGTYIFYAGAELLDVCVFFFGKGAECFVFAS